MKVKIKTWEAMEREFGLDCDGHIDCDRCFTSGMEMGMPPDRIIDVQLVTSEHGGDTYYVWDIWDVSDDMIEAVIDRAEGIASDNFDMSKGGVKYDADKARMDLIPMDALMEIGHVFAFGADKYSDWNWAKGMRWGRMLAAAMRHIGKFLLGEDLDKETGRSHLAHAGCCILMCLGCVMRKMGEDDRFDTPNLAWKDNKWEEM